jgi:hypothetical protein
MLHRILIAALLSGTTLTSAGQLRSGFQTVGRQGKRVLGTAKHDRELTVFV